MLNSWQRLQALPKTIIRLKGRERRRKDAAFPGVRKSTLENAPVGIKNADRGKHASTYQGRARDFSIFQIADPKPWTWRSDRYEKVLV
jgi:hypothetical protein